MQPVKITISGRYWDSYLYSGSLFLVQRDGGLTVVNWDSFIDSIPIDDDLAMPLECAFKRSDYLYNSEVNKILIDREIKEVVVDKFERLSLKGFYFERLNSVVGTRDNPFSHPNSDLTIYKNKMYVSSQSGLYSARFDKKLRYRYSRNVEKLWDCPTLAISALYSTLAISTGDEGLFEIPLYDHFAVQDTIRPTLSRNSISCNWNYWSIYSSSHLCGGSLISYCKNPVEENSFGYASREFDKIINERELFNEDGYSWGLRDKICLAKNGEVHIIKYSPSNTDPDEILQDLGVVRLEEWKGKVIDGGISLYGVIIECENAIVVVPTNGSPFTISGEAIRWRTFPRSKHYENQLHVIFDDRLEIYSFNHDYFVDQDQKRLGIRYSKF